MSLVRRERAGLLKDTEKRHPAYPRVEPACHKRRNLNERTLYMRVKNAKFFEIYNERKKQAHRRGRGVARTARSRRSASAIRTTIRGFVSFCLFFLQARVLSCLNIPISALFPVRVAATRRRPRPRTSSARSASCAQAWTTARRNAPTSSQRSVQLTSRVFLLFCFCSCVGFFSFSLSFFLLLFSCLRLSN